MGVSSFDLFAGCFTFLSYVICDITECSGNRVDMEVLGVVWVKVFEDSKVVSVDREGRSEDLGQHHGSGRFEFFTIEVDTE